MVPGMSDEEPRIDRCPTCGRRDFRYIADDVVQCQHCTYLWIRSPEGEDGPDPGGDAAA